MPPSAVDQCFVCTHIALQPVPGSEGCTDPRGSGKGDPGASAGPVLTAQGCPMLGPCHKFILPPVGNCCCMFVCT